jgi:succinate-acetate transporter protein
MVLKVRKEPSPAKQADPAVMGFMGIGMSAIIREAL